MQVKRVDMRQCQFVYQDGRQSNHIGGSRCKKEAKYRAGMLCQLHRRRKTGVNGIGLEGGKQDHSFPRLFTHEEERRWVDEARKRTSPAENMRATCVVCGRLTEHQDVVIVTEFGLLRARHLLRRPDCYKHVPDSEFMYGVGYSRVEGLVLNQEGFLKEDEIAYGTPIMARMCKACHDVLHKDKLPVEALANCLWMGAGQVDALSGLTWVEEKLISRVHVSVQVQKCRILRNW